MKPNPKRKLTPAKLKKLRAETKAIALPRADAAAAHTREIITAEQEAVRAEICRRVTDIRDRVLANAQEKVRIVNDCRELGLFILKDWEALPGRQMTIDFWQRMQHLYRDRHGQPITLENLKWFVKLATAEPKPITEIVHAESYDKQMLALCGFCLAGEAPGTGQPQNVNHFLLLTGHLPKWSKEVQLRIRALESDSHFGPLEKWPVERKQLALAKVRPAFEALRNIYERLAGAETEAA